MKALILGEIVGRAGYTAVKKGLKDMSDIDLVIANGEGMFNGYGINKINAINLMKAGVDVITGGEKLFYKSDMQDFIKETSRVIRAYNYPSPDVPGHGIKYIKINDTNVAVLNLMGTSGMRVPLNNPFTSAEYIVKKIKETTPAIIVIFHASASAEKQSMFRFLDGKVTAVIGTHSKILTADATVSENGTAYITDNGRCASTLSVGGFKAEEEIKKYRSTLLVRSKECFDDTELQGVTVTFNENGKAENIETIRKKITIDRTDINKT